VTVTTQQLKQKKKTFLFKLNVAFSIQETGEKGINKKLKNVCWRDRVANKESAGFQLLPAGSFQLVPANFNIPEISDFHSHSAINSCFTDSRER